MMAGRVKVMNLPRKSTTLLLLISLLSMPLWLFLTEPYVVKPSPLKLYEVIHPIYYIGLTALILSIAILSVRAKENSHSALNPYLLTAILATLYLQLPPIALFEHPVSDHTIHLVSAFYMLREGNINMPNYPFPETVSPQLFASIFIMITSVSNPLENLNCISVFLLPLLITLFVYIFMRRLGVSKRFAMMASVLNMGLIHFSFMFLRQTYAMPLYMMLGLLILAALKEKKASFSILAIITSVAFVMSDPAHVMLTIIPLAFFTIADIGVNLVSKTKHGRLRSPWILVLIIGVSFLFWITERYCHLLIDLWSIANKMWDVFITSINELSYQHPASSVYWGKPTALQYNAYYALLYNVRIVLIGFSIILPTALLVYAFLNRKNRPIILRPETAYLTSYFLITSIVIITQGYGFTFTPWAAMTMFYMLNNLTGFRQSNHSAQKAVTFLILSLVLTSIIVAPNIINVEGERISTADLHLSIWLGEHAPLSFHIETPFAGYDLDDIAYMIGGYRFTKGWYIPYGGLSEEAISKVASFENVALAGTMDFKFFEKTNAVYSLPEFLEDLTSKLCETHSLVYTSGPYNTVWIKQ